MVLKVENVKKIYSQFKSAKETEALKGINLEIKKGELVAIMGASGSGKTTLLNILVGIDSCTSGNVFIEDNNIALMKKDELAKFRRTNIGYIFQDFNLLDSITVEENIALPLILENLEPKEIKEKTKKIMDFLEINDLSDKYAYHISGGQKQRVAIARAVINNPNIVFADEPTGNLDSKSANNVMETLVNMNESLQSTILMVSHDPFASSFCRKVIFIKDGEVQEIIENNGNRKEFFERILEKQSIIGGN